MAESNPIATSDVLGISVCRFTVSEFITWLLGNDNSEPETRFVTYLNAACSNIAADDHAYREILQQADCVYADGQAIVWAARLLGNPLPERVNAGDFIIHFCRELARRNLTIALVGGRPGVASAAAAVWLQQVPDLQIISCSDGFFQDDGKAAIADLSAHRADVLLVGMGVPLQEKWAWSHRNQTGAKVVWCVGALFEYYGEGRARAPVWIRRAGLEWLFRLFLEPRRLWKRYLIGNVRFVWRVIAAKRRSYQ